MAKELNITPPYLSDVEKDRRNPFDLERLQLIASILLLSEEDKSTTMDLSGKKRNQIAPDLIEYIKERSYVTASLRAAKDLDVGEEDWVEFINTLKRKI